jgi:hypothetical protein
MSDQKQSLNRYLAVAVSGSWIRANTYFNVTATALLIFFCAVLLLETLTGANFVCVSAHVLSQQYYFEEKYMIAEQSYVFYNI